ncbi:MAG: translation machinery-associated protein 16 [Terriglobus roseus]|nr:translation machinery-associated protein 16 [Terriglobus roseus]
MVQRVAFFQDIVQTSDVPSYDVEDMLALIRSFISRNDDALKDAKASRRSGRPPSKEETDRTQQKDSEERELTAGFWLPALHDAQNVKALREWNGDWVALGQLKFSRVTRESVLRDGTWPPNR